MSSNKESAKSSIIELDEKHISHIIAAFLIFCFFVFIGGYYWGKKSASEILYNQLENDSLTDQVKKACYIDLPDSNEGDIDEAEVPDSQEFPELAFVARGETSNNSDNNFGNNFGKESHKENNQSLSQETDENIDMGIDTSIDKNKDSGIYVQEEYAAHLAGFGTHQAAQQCVDNYAKHGYKVSISERIGKTAKGKIRQWYQVVTPWYQNKEELHAILINLKKIGRLKEVTLVARDKKEN